MTGGSDDDSESPAINQQGLELAFPELIDDSIEIVLDSIELTGSEEDLGSIGSSRESRVRALAWLYEGEIKDKEVPSTNFDRDLANELVQGVLDNRDRIRGYISRATKDWSIDRMPLIDQLIASIAVYELIKRRNVSVAVIIDEALDLANMYSTENSPRFLNGVLSTIAQEIRPEQAKE